MRRRAGTASAPCRETGRHAPVSTGLPASSRPAELRPLLAAGDPVFPTPTSMPPAQPWTTERCSTRRSPRSASPLSMLPAGGADGMWPVWRLGQSGSLCWVIATTGNRCRSRSNPRAPWQARWQLPMTRPWPAPSPAPPSLPRQRRCGSPERDRQATGRARDSGPGARRRRPPSPSSCTWRSARARSRAASCRRSCACSCRRPTRRRSTRQP